MEQMSLNLTDDLTCLRQGGLAKASQLRERGRAWRKEAERGQVSSLKSSAFSGSCNLGIYSQRTCPAALPATRDGISHTSSWRWLNAGILSRGECWMLSMSEWTGCPAQFLSEDGVCGLSDVLETTSPSLRKYYLRPTALSGILRRAAARGKALPALLQSAIQAMLDWWKTQPDAAEKSAEKRTPEADA